MFRLIAVTLAVLYAIMHTFGDEARRPDVTRAEPLGLGLVQAAYTPNEDVAPLLNVRSRISDDEAVKLALEAGVRYRAELKRKPLRGVAQIASASKKVDVPTAEAASPAYWYVTGSTVNLRSGPGTSNQVVGQLSFGREAEVLGDQNGWYQIRTADGAASGWIHGKFLDERLPG